MKKLFEYNWKVRDECLELCKQIDNVELLRNRIGGAGNTLYTLFHIIDVENSWIRGIQGKQDIQVDFRDYNTLVQVKKLSESWITEIRLFIDTWTNDNENEVVNIVWAQENYTKGEIMRHIIAHEIHHMGQLSLWIREIGLKPVSANFIGRGLSKRVHLEK